MSDQAVEPPSPLRDVRCLVLDDNLLIALDIEYLLRGAGVAQVVCAGNVTDALAALQNEPPFAAAVLDISVGSDDSMAVPAELKRRGIPFVFLTGMGGDDPRARRYPEAPVVDKPYRAETLLKALLHVLGKR